MDVLLEFFGLNEWCEQSPGTREETFPGQAGFDGPAEERHSLIEIPFLGVSGSQSKENFSMTGMLLQPLGQVQDSFIGLSLEDLADVFAALLPVPVVSPADGEDEKKSQDGDE